jgi:hypothetical protein
MEQRRATRRVTSIALTLALASQAGCGIAERAGKGAAEGALGNLAGRVPEREELKQLAKGIKQRAAGGVVSELSQPERLEDIQRIAAALAAGTVSGASRAASGAPEAVSGTRERGSRETRAVTPVEAIAQQAARAFSQQITLELGRTGDGPLATSLGATTEQVTASMVRGAREELAPLFPECRGADASKCLDSAVERLSRASSAGVAAGVRESLGVWPLVLAFAVGVFFALALTWAWGLHRAHRPAPTS